MTEVATVEPAIVATDGTDPAAFTRPTANVESRQKLKTDSR